MAQLNSCHFKTIKKTSFENFQTLEMTFHTGLKSLEDIGACRISQGKNCENFYFPIYRHWGFARAQNSGDVINFYSLPAVPW